MNPFYSRLTASLIGTAATIALVQPHATALTPSQINEIAKGITVLVDSQYPGSGILLSRQGNTYTVLTAAHVVATEDRYAIITPDNRRYPVNYNTVVKVPGADLAIVQFSSNQSYNTASLGDSTTITEGSEVHIAGFPNPGREIRDRIYQFTSGQISGRPEQALRDGYALIYTNVTRAGMSGGPVLDGNGRVIGVHGRAEGESLAGDESGITVNGKVGFNLGIPINTFLNYAPQIGLNLSSSVATLPPVSSPPQSNPQPSTPRTATRPTPTINYLNLALANNLGRTGGVVVVSPDGLTIAKDHKIYNRLTGQPILSYRGNAFGSVAISSDGKFLAFDYTTSSGSDLIVWNLETNKIVKDYYHSGEILSIAFSPDGKTVVTGSADQSIRFWDVSNSKVLRTIIAHSSTVKEVAISPDGRTLVSGSDDGTVKIWDFATGEILRVIEAHPSHKVNSVVFHPNGQTIASGSSDGTIKIWNLETGQLIRKIDIGWWISAVAISPDGQTLVSGGRDGFRLWNLQTGQLLRNLESATLADPSRASISFSTDGRTLVTSARGTEVKVWRIPGR